MKNTIQGNPSTGSVNSALPPHGVATCDHP
jgi:hypothetical protein